MHGETDIMMDIAGALALAKQVAATKNIIVYVWDHTFDPDDTGLFSALTGNKPGHVIRSSDDQTELLQKLQKQMIPEFINIGCGGAGATTMVSRTTTAMTPTSTSTPALLPGCSLLIFVEEASHAIGFDSKLMFLHLVQKLVSSVGSNANQRFAIAFYGAEIYHEIVPQTLDDFSKSVTKYIDEINFGNFPNGAKTYLQP